MKLYLVIACLMLISCHEDRLSESDKQKLINIIQELEQGVSQGNNEAWKKYMAEDAILFNRDGKGYTKEEIVSEITPLPNGKLLDITPVNFKVFNNNSHSATITFMADEKLSIWGQVVDTKYPSVMYFEKRKAGWQMVMFTYFELPYNPPAIYVTKENLLRYEGIYRVSDSLRMEIVAQDSFLLFKKMGSKVEGARLYPITEDGRFFKKDSELEYIFSVDTTGKQILRQRRNWIDLIYSKE